MQMGDPSVLLVSRSRPDKTSTMSSSSRAVTSLLCPGLRRASQDCTCSTSNVWPDEQPSTTQPTATPWLSPNVVTQKLRPKVLPSIESCVFYTARETKTIRD